MKLYELINNNSNVQIATASFKGHIVNFRLVRGTRKNDLNTWTIQVKVDAKGETWATCLWVNATDELSQTLTDLRQKFTHLTIEEIFKATPKRQKSVKKNTKKQAYYIKNTNAGIGQSTTIKTDKPLFEVL